tara:strand:+ start:764 stop:988 length:225 start_codon:yes stop_codon:yes gene_type:complete
MKVAPVRDSMFVLIKYSLYTNLLFLGLSLVLDSGEFPIKTFVIVNLFSFVFLYIMDQKEDLIESKKRGRGWESS